MENIDTPDVQDEPGEGRGPDVDPIRQMHILFFADVFYSKSNII